MTNLAGFLHPLIHLGFGIEFKQPAIIAEALAQAAVHENWIARVLLDTEKIAAESGDQTSKSMIELIHEVRANDKIRTSPHWDDGNKIRDGVLKRAPEEMMRLAAQWRVSTDKVEEKTAEMVNADAYFTGGAQMPPKEIKFDFYYMHSVNCSIFFSAFMKLPELGLENKVRLLEWKGRYDLASYASRGSPQLRMDDIRHYRPNKPEMGWPGIIKRVNGLEDDGHVAKLIRALAHGEELCKEYSGEAFPIQSDMWLKLGHMVIDSVEETDAKWVRNAGFQQAWEKVADRPRL